MKKAGQIGKFIFHYIQVYLEPGIKTKDISDKVEKIIYDHGAIPEFLNYPGKVPFPASCCISINEEICHGIPSDRTLSNGDLVSIDLGIRIREHIVDACQTFEIGEVSEEAKDLNSWTKIALKRALRYIRNGRNWNDIAHIIENTVTAKGYKPIKTLTGHGIGTKLHEPPILRNYACEENKDIILETGQTICIEPMITARTEETVISKDHWTIITEDNSLSAHWEHCIIVTETGCEILL